MVHLQLKLTAMAHGGNALGRDPNGRVIFVPQTIPNETVLVEVADTDKRFAQGALIDVVEPSADRVAPRCEHFEAQTCSHFQHIDYSAQLRLKREVIADQMKRIGGLDVPVNPVIASPQIWHAQREVVLYPTAEGSLGYWSAVHQRLAPIDTCHLLHPALQTLAQDFDLALPTLHRVTLRVGEEEELLVALEVEQSAPPHLEVDFPVSVAIILPDQTTANLIGHNFITQQIKGREFQISASCFFYPNPAVTALLIDAVLEVAALDENDVVWELFSGVGLLTAFLAQRAQAVIGIERNGDAVADAVANLDEYDNVDLYQASVEDTLPRLNMWPDVVVISPPARGLSHEIIRALLDKRPPRLVYVSRDVATLARDVKRFVKAGYQLQPIQPLDVEPHTYRHVIVAPFQWGK